MLDSETTTCFCPSLRSTLVMTWLTTQRGPFRSSGRFIIYINFYVPVENVVGLNVGVNGVDVLLAMKYITN